MRGRFLFLALALSVCVLPRSWGQQFPALARGFESEKVYEFGELDDVNLYNGNLVITVPIGLQYPLNGGLEYGLSLTFNSKVWDVSSSGSVVHAVPSRRANAGLGWLLSMGRFVPRDDASNESGLDVYESPDGADHSFDESNVGTECGALGCSPLYTRDGSNLRLRRISATTVKVDSPDGVTRSFTKSDSEWRLSEIRSALGTDTVTVQYPAPSGYATQCPAADSLWVISDSQSRTHYVCFKNRNYGGITRPMVDRAVLIAFGGTTARYMFDYGTNQTVAKGIEDTDTSALWPQSYSVPFLRILKLPDGSDETCTNDDCSRHAFEYYLSGYAPGAVKSTTLPTRGTVEYDYRSVNIPSREMCDTTYGKGFGFGGKTSGVYTRTFRNAAGQSLGTWIYERELRPGPSTEYVAVRECQSPDEAPFHPQLWDEMVVIVKGPTGDKTESHFSVWPGNDYGRTPDPDISPAGFRAEHYGRPYGAYDEGQNRHLSQEVFDCDAAGASCRRARALYVRQHQLADCDHCWRTVSERTAFLDDAAGCTPTGVSSNCRYVTTDHSSHDGYGHFRTVQTRGNFVSLTAEELRTVTTNYNPGADSAGLLNGSMLVAPTSNWITNTFDSVTTTEGSATAKEQFCFDLTTGFLRARRTLAGTTPQSTDLLAVFTADTAGNLQSEKFHGADFTPLTGTAATSANVCDAIANPGTVGFQIDHTWSFGTWSSSRYKDASFKSLDQTIDATGLVASSSDTTGLTTTFAYDALGRMTSVAPPGDAPTSISYRVATVVDGVFTPANALLTTTVAGAGSVKAEFQYESFGRLWREKRWMPDDTWSVRETKYDALGRKISLSSWQTLTGTNEYAFVPSHRTEWHAYDAGGRPGEIRSADGSVLSFRYTGNRLVERTRSVATGVNQQTNATVRERYDAFGRLRSVAEYPSQYPADDSTFYGYDVANRLVQVTANSPSGNQSRLFSYDNRGFLLFEQHPELGASGNGRITYQNYDARGHARRKTTGTANGAFDLTLELDHAERLTRVARTSSNQSLKLFAYDDPDGVEYPQCTGRKCNGRIAAAGRYNDPQDLGGIWVTESYHYEGRGGRLSRRDRVVGSTSAFTGESFAISQTYNSLGEVETITYPCRVVSGQCNGSDRSLTVEQRYMNGFLRGVTNWANAISYRGNGTIGTVTHGSGESATNEVWDADDHGLPRPKKIRLTNASGTELWSSGTYLFDGSGNVKQVGERHHFYDHLGRLTGWEDRPSAGGYARNDRGYDAFGNYLYTSVRGCGLQGGCYTSSMIQHVVDAATNHYAGLTYDDAGNVTGDGRRTFHYDSLGMQDSATVDGRQFRYLYSADDERIAIVERKSGSDQIVRNRTSWTLRGLDSRLLRTMIDDFTGGSRVVTWKEDQIWRGSALLATDRATSPRHAAVDHLGSIRAQTDSAGQLFNVQNFAPFGAGGTIDSGSLQFTAHERDSASVGDGFVDLPDYMHARFFDLQFARFLSVDPGRDWDPRQPQSWNMYSYVRNNPINSVDPTGKWAFPWEVLDWAAYQQSSREWTESAYEFTANPTLRNAGNVSVKFIVAALDGAALLLPVVPAAGGHTQRVVNAGTETVTQLQKNKAQGDAFRDKVADFMTSQGRAVEKEVVKHTPFGDRRIDVEVSMNGKVLGGLETKTGNSRYTASQRVKDWWLRTFKNYLVNVVREAK